MPPVNRNAPTRAKSSESQYSIMEFVQRFPNDASCLNYLWETRFATSNPNEAHCPRCEEIREFKHYERKTTRQAWTCVACGLDLYPTAGTIFHKSSTSLHLWFYAMYIMASTRCGISAKQLEGELGVTYKTAWRMFTLIRNQLMSQDELLALSGSVEMDETYVGGKPHQSDRAKWATAPNSTARRQAAQAWSHDRKTPVFGMVRRSGKVAAHVVPKKPQAAVIARLEVQVDKLANVYTDDAAMYKGLPDRGFNHESVNHTARVYVS